MSRFRAPGAGRHGVVMTIVFAAFLALAAAHGDGRAAAGGGADSSAPVTAGGSGLGDLLVPTRGSVAAGSGEPAWDRARTLSHGGALLAGVVLLVVLVAGFSRGRPGPPWHQRRRHSAVLRAPPLLLHR